MATAIGYKAQAGAKMLYDFLTEALAPHADRIAHDGTSATRLGQTAVESASQNTLTPADLAPAWRGPPARKDAKHAA